MSFSASNGLTQPASDNFAVGDGKAGPATSDLFAGSASFLVTVTGPTTFTAAYREGDGGGTARFYSSNIIIQVFN
jgi:hypothetical protein